VGWPAPPRKRYPAWSVCSQASSHGHPWAGAAHDLVSS
jgi:hypothetical protein